jgi:hypothetical protein
VIEMTEIEQNEASKKSVPEQANPVKQSETQQETSQATTPEATPTEEQIKQCQEEVKKHENDDPKELAEESKKLAEEANTPPETEHQEADDEEEPVTQNILTQEEINEKKADDEEPRTQEEIDEEERYKEYCREEDEYYQQFAPTEEDQQSMDEQPYALQEKTMMTELRGYIENSVDADPEFIEAIVMETLAVLAFNFKIQECTTDSFNDMFEKTKNLKDIEGKPLNLWMILFGESRKSRKTTTMHKIENLLQCMEKEYDVRILTPKSMTPQSLASLSKGV